MSSINSSFAERSPLLSQSRSSAMKGLFRNVMTADDRHVISQFLLDAENEMKGFQVEMNRLRSAMHLLENRRNGLKKTMEKCRSLLSPVHRLPAEILAIIFSLCCETNELVRPSCVPAALQIVRVCGRWRDIGLGTPSLWSSILIDFQGWRDQVASLTSLTELFMQRSGGSLLDLNLEPYTDDVVDSDAGHESRHSFTPVMKALSQNCGRWKSLSLYTSETFPQQNRLFDGVHGQSFPLLQKLFLIEIGLSTGLPDNLRGLFTHCPSLQTLAVSFPFLDSRLALPWHQIRKLHVLDGSPRSTLSFVSLHPHLEYLNLYHTSIDRDSQPYSGHIISDTIKKLATTFEGPKDVTTLSYVTLSGLTSLDMKIALDKVASWQVWDDSIIKDFLARSGCFLTTLKIDSIPMSDRQIINLLEQTPTLSSLHIEEAPTKTPNTMMTSAFFQRLVVDHEDVNFQSNRALLPSLTELTMVIRARGLLEQDLFDAVSSRQIPDPLHAKELGVECLRSVSITLMGGDASEHSMSSLECFRDAGLRLLVSHKPL